MYGGCYVCVYPRCLGVRCHKGALQLHNTRLQVPFPLGVSRNQNQEEDNVTVIIMYYYLYYNHILLLLQYHKYTCKYTLICMFPVATV